MKRIVFALFAVGVALTFTETVHSQIANAKATKTFTRVNDKLGTTKYTAVGDTLDVLVGFDINTFQNFSWLEGEVTWKHGTTSTTTLSRLYLIPGGRGPGWGTPSFTKNVGFSNSKFTVPATGTGGPTSGTGGSTSGTGGPSTPPSTPSTPSTPQLMPLKITACVLVRWSGIAGSGQVTRSVKFTEGTGGGGGGSPSGGGGSGVPIIPLGND